MTTQKNNFASKMIGLVKNHSEFNGSVTHNMGNIKLTASFEDFETGDFSEAEEIYTTDSFNDSELSDFFEKLENEEFEIKSNTTEGLTTVVFGCPDSVYGLSVNNIYV